LLKNHLKIALRSARRQGGITALNIVELANGIARFVDRLLDRQLSSEKDSFG
jgi:hypothetical protein